MQAKGNRIPSADHPLMRPGMALAAVGLRLGPGRPRIVVMAEFMEQEVQQRASPDGGLPDLAEGAASSITSHGTSSRLNRS